MRPFGTVERDIPAIAGREARPRWSPLVLAVQIGVVGLITVPAWLLGGIEPGIQLWLLVTASCAMLVCWFACLGRRTVSTPLPLALIPLAVVISLGILQLAPLPLSVHRRSNCFLWRSLPHWSLPGIDAQRSFLVGPRDRRVFSRCDGFLGSTRFFDRGRLPEAQEQARVCVRTDPENQEYEALLREVIRTQLSLRRRSHADI